MKLQTLLTAFFLTCSVAGIAQNTFPVSGNVGIGTTTPGQKLSVLGNISASVGSNEGASLILENTAKTLNDQAYRWVLYNMTGGYGNSLQFWNYSQDVSFYGPRFTILDNGNVGIATTTPGEKLSVNGNASINGKIGAKEVKVEAKEWPDYVFKKDYVLPALGEIEKHIKEKGHLPGIPSAKEVEVNGIELGEMNKLLLKKIEELTLYMIDQKKILNVQNDRLEAQQRQLEKQQCEINTLKK